MIRIGYILMPLCFLSFGHIHRGHHVTFALLALCFIARLINTLSVRWFFYYAVAWCFVIKFGVLFLGGEPIRGYRSFNGVFYLMVAAITYLAVTKTEIHIRHFYNAICIAAIIQMTLGIMQRFGLDPVLWVYNLSITQAMGRLPKVTPIGTLGNPNFLAGYLAISAPFFFRDKWKWFLFPMAILMYYMQATSGFAAMVAAIIVFFWKDEWHKWRIATISILAVCVYAFWLDSGLVLRNPRVGYWTGTLKEIFSSPYTIIFGNGPRALTGLRFPLHNEYIELFFQYGTIGIALLAVYFVEIYSTLKTNRILFAAFTAACVNCLGSYPMHLAPSLFLILIILGLIERERHGRFLNFSKYLSDSSTVSKG